MVSAPKAAKALILSISAVASPPRLNVFSAASNDDASSSASVEDEEDSLSSSPPSAFALVVFVDDAPLPEKLSINPTRVASGGGEGEGGGDGAITVADGVRQLAKIVHSLRDDAKDKPFEPEMSWLCEGRGWKHQGVSKDVIADAVEWAKREINDSTEDEDDDDDDDEEVGGGDVMEE